MGMAQSACHDVPWHEYDKSTAMHDFFAKTPDRATAFMITVVKTRQLPVYTLPMILDKLRSDECQLTAHNIVFRHIIDDVDQRSAPLKYVSIPALDKGDAKSLPDDQHVVITVGRQYDSSSMGHSVSCILEPLDAATNTRTLLWLDSDSKTSGPDFVEKLQKEITTTTAGVVIKLERPLSAVCNRMQPLSLTCRMWSALLMLVSMLHPDSKTLRKLRAVSSVHELNHELRMFIFWIYERVMNRQLPLEAVIDNSRPLFNPADAQVFRKADVQRMVEHVWGGKDRHTVPLDVVSTYAGSDLLTVLSSGKVSNILTCCFGVYSSATTFHAAGSDLMDFKIQYVNVPGACRPRCGSFCYDADVSYCRAHPYNSRPFPRAAGRWNAWLTRKPLDGDNDQAEWVVFNFLRASSPDSVFPHVHRAVTHHIQHIRDVGCVYAVMTKNTIGNDATQFPWRRRQGAVQNLFAVWRTDEQLARLTMLVLALMQPGYAGQYVWPAVMTTPIANMPPHIPADPENVCTDYEFGAWAPVWRMLYICMMHSMQAAFNASRVRKISPGDIVDEMCVFVSWIYTDVLKGVLPHEMFVLGGGETPLTQWKAVLSTMVPQIVAPKAETMTRSARLVQAAAAAGTDVFSMLCLPDAHHPNIYKNVLTVVNGMCMAPPHHFQNLSLPRLVQLASPRMHRKLTGLLLQS